MIHPLGYVEGVFEKALDTDIGPQGCMLYSLEHYRSKNAEHKLGYMMHALRGAGPVETALSVFKRRKMNFGTQLYHDFFDYYKKQLVITVICEDIPEINNRINLDYDKTDRFGVAGISVQYKLHNNSKKLLSNGINNARSLLREAGATKTFAHGPVRNTGWHIMGTARMGEDPKNSVVNPIGKSHDVDGLYVIDSSCFVTGSCVNPANTIQTIALYLADQIEEYARHEP
jgi:choline dehydrogenase-like flavoprotein